MKQQTSAANNAKPEGSPYISQREKRRALVMLHSDLQYSIIQALSTKCLSKIPEIRQSTALLYRDL
eukprot:scaffold111610_cov24-Prasinocladus_malaysianus.AAC.1